MLDFARVNGGFEVRRRPYTPHDIVHMNGQPALTHQFGLVDALVAGDQWPFLQNPMLYYLCANDLEARPCPYQR